MNKQKYVVTIEEVVAESFDIEAESMEQAIEIAHDKYRNCEIVLEPGYLMSKQMKCDYPADEKTTDWFEF